MILEGTGKDPSRGIVVGSGSSDSDEGIIGNSAQDVPNALSSRECGLPGL